MGTVGCGDKTDTEHSHGNPQHILNAPQIAHTITVSTKTDLGSQPSPTIQTCVSIAAGDQILWVGTDGRLKFTWTLNVGGSHPICGRIIIKP
jgi:hypothetical protein